MQFDGRYKGIDNGPDVPPELYDLKTDPHEFTNLRSVPEQKELLAKALAELWNWIRQDVCAPMKHRGRGSEGDI